MSISRNVAQRWESNEGCLHSACCRRQSFLVLCDLLEQILIAFLLCGTSKVLVVVMDTHGPLVYCIVLYVQNEAGGHRCCQLFSSMSQNICA